MGNAATTRQRIMERGLALVSQYGLGGLTLGVLAEDVGMSKSGLFAHFKSKDEMQGFLLEYAGEFGQPFVLEPAMREPEGLPRLRSLVRHWFGWAPRSGLPGGCPLAAGMFEYDDVAGPVRDKIAELERAWTGLLEAWTRRAVELGHLRGDLDVAQFVWEIGGIYLQHHVSQRFRRAPESDERAYRAFDALIERSQPAPPTVKPRRAR